MGGLIDKVPVERNFNVSFSLEDVKVAMDKLSSSSIHYKIENKNDVFNSYTMAFVGGNTISQNELLDKYFNLLGSYLAGDEETIKQLDAQSKKGCMGIILIGFGLFTSTLYYIMS
jgi:hypothetical protein